MNEITKELLDALHDCERVMSAELKGLLVIQPELEKARAAIAKAEATLAATEPSYDDWIPWKGGECPVERRAVVMVKGKNGEVDTDKAHFYDWNHTGCPFDIVAYRIVKESDK